MPGSPHPWLHQLRQDPLIGVIRHPDPAQALILAELAIETGLTQIEITATVPQFGEIIAKLQQRFQPGISIGAGTITTSERAMAALEAGSAFWIGPILDPAILNLAQTAGIPVVMGGLTPSEIWQAHQLGATAVKVFPVIAVGGSVYLEHLRQPLAGIPLIPTGGVTLDNALSYLQAGAIAVAVGSDLFPAEWVRHEQWSRIRQRIEEGIQRIRGHCQKGQG